jgi:hypothetical protein
MQVGFNDNDLIVSGYEYGCKGVIVNYNPEGKLIFTYKEERPDIPFIPRGLTCSPNGNILICNEYNVDDVRGLYKRILQPDQRKCVSSKL